MADATLVIKMLLVAIAPVLFVYSLVALWNAKKGREHYVVIVAGMLLAIAALAHGLDALDSNEAYGWMHDLSEIALMLLFFIVLREHIHEHLRSNRARARKPPWASSRTRAAASFSRGKTRSRRSPT